MIITFGKYYGRSVEWLIVEDPAYVDWLLGCPSPRGRMRLVCDEARRLIASFDSKPILVQCEGKDCNALATRLIMCCGVTRPTYLCLTCNPRNPMLPSSLADIRTYQEAIQFIKAVWFGNKRAMRELIGLMVKAKNPTQRAHEERSEMSYHRWIHQDRSDPWW